ncbi:hypothetical protein RD792_004503 [Penstemon davidsonii]|uniref:RRM domain-containing protein n=1 Tax=Penstemon davidsonii TaxID=160366 RepID=A0ABR0DIY6_9LAMI|nr:hypothetical protein RD792_004503 [Penstemon davidsonii]
MPSEMTNPRGLSSSSFFPEEVSVIDEGQVGAWKMDHVPGYYGLKTGRTLRTTGVASSALENRVSLDSQMAKGFDLPEYYLRHGRNVNLSPGKHFVGAERAASHSLPTAAEHDLVKLPTNNAVVYGHSVGAAVAASTHCEEEEAFESLEELEAQTIGNLLPDDDDLLSGVTDGFDSCIQPRNGEDMEDLDLFSSVGGLELGEDGSELSDVNSNNQLGVSRGSRTLFVRNINSNVEDSELQTIFEQYGDIRTLYMACKNQGFVMVSYYDIRASCNAMKALQDKPLMGRKLDIHFSIPKGNLSEKDINPGTIGVYNLDSSVPNNQICEIFSVYGEIKEIRETPQRSNLKFVEFYDVRAAESALRALNRSDIAGKQIKLEPGQPSGFKSDMYRSMPSEQDHQESDLHLQRHSPSNNLATGYSGSLLLGGTSFSVGNGTILGPRWTNGGPISSVLDNVLHPGLSSGVANSLSSLGRVDSGNQNHLKFDLQGMLNLHPHSLPEYHDGLANGTSHGSPSTIASNISSRPPEINDNQQFRRVSSNGQSVEFNEVFGSSGNGSCPPPGRHYIWSSNSHHPQSQGIAWPNSPSFAHPQQLHAVHRAPSHMLNAALVPLNNHHVGSAPSLNHAIWERRHAYAGESSPDATVFHPGSLGNNMRISGNSFVPHNIFPQTGGNCMDLPISSKSIGLQHPNHQRGMIFPGRGQVIPMMSSFDSPNERTRSRRNEGNSSQADNKKQFELDVDRIMRGEDKRTTLMLKNIPNKYTSKMLLAAIDERHRGTYDFIYLPIDFKNKCNVGYAFINMTDPSLIVHFYQTFNGKKWEKFNSEKVATLAYARIQGKAALVAHFQNSSLMNEDKRCRPILFHTNGPNAGDQVPFPMGANIRPRPCKIRASTEENNQEMPDYLNGDSSSGSGKDSD